MAHCVTITCFNTTLKKQTDDSYNESMQPLWEFNWEIKADDAAKRVGSFGTQIVVSNKAINIFGWIELIVLCNNPISVCENEILRKHLKLKPVHRRTLRKYIILLADVVGLKIKRAIGPGSCVADGWGCAGIHYFAVLHRWFICNAKGEVEMKEALLSCQPLIDETSLTAESQAESIRPTY